MAGCKSAWETEQLTETLSPAMRRLLELPRRLADTTLRDALCRPALVAGLRAALHRLVKAGWRRKALEPVGLPLSVVALDGKVTALPCLSDEAKAATAGTGEDVHGEDLLEEVGPPRRPGG